MRKVTIFFCIVILLLSLPDILVHAAEFDTGIIRVNLNSYGRVRLYTSGLDSLRQIDRTSILVGIDENSVFDYAKDADTEVAAELVADPQLSDFELYGSVNNQYSGAPPDLIIENNVYGWTDAGYCIVKFTVHNNETGELNAICGLEILPQINDEYGNEVVDCLETEGVVSVHKTDDYVGYKWLSTDLISLKTFEWYSGYNDLDRPLWEALNYGQFDLTYQSGPDGAVAIPAQDFVMIPVGGSVEIYFAIAYATTEADMLTNIGLAIDAYNILGISPERVASRPIKSTLLQNYPNPFNPSTTISFELARRETVLLRVFNHNGKSIETLIDSILEPGHHVVEFSAGNLPSGVYFYSLKAGMVSECRKMLLIK
jgi:hypothetical protein